MLVEEARVEVEDAVADDVEAEVARLDHAGVDRADRDLVGVVAVHGHGPALESQVVVGERAQRLVSVEDHAVQVVRLALVPAGGGREVDDRRHRAVCDPDRLDMRLALRVDEERPHVARRSRTSPAKRRPPASASATRAR